MPTAGDQWNGGITIWWFIGLPFMQKPKSKPPQPQKYNTAENEEMILSALPFSESLPTGFAFSPATNAPLAMHMTEPLALILPPGKVGAV